MTNHSYHAVQHTGIVALRTVLSETVFGERLTEEDTAETVFLASKWCLSGHEHTVNDMLDPQKSWSSQLFLGEIGVCRHSLFYFYLLTQFTDSTEKICGICS